MVVQRLHIEIAVDIKLTVIRNGVTHIRTVFQLRSPYPIIGSIIVSISCQPVEYGQLVEWYLIRGSKRLAVVQRCTEVADAMPY